MLEKTLKLKPAKFSKLCALFFIALLISACVKDAPKTTYQTPLTPEMSKAYNNAEYFFKNGDFTSAGPRLINYINQYLYNQYTDYAYSMLGDIAKTSNNCPLAIDYYKKAIKGLYNPSLTPMIQFKSAKCAFEIEKYDEAISFVSSIERKDLPLNLLVEADSVGFMSAKAGGKSPIVFSLFLLDDYASGAQTSGITQTVAQLTVDEWLNNKDITSKEIKSFPLDKFKGKTSGGYVEYKLAETLINEGQNNEAKSVLKNYLITYGKHPYYGKANNLIMDAGSSINIKIGVILPLSGSFERYGYSVLKGIECSAGIFEPCNAPNGIELVIKDAEETNESAVKAVRELAEENVIAIIGPLRSNFASDALIVAGEVGVPVITMAQTPDIAKTNDYSFRNSISEEDETKTLSDWISKQSNIKKIFIMYPDNKKGEQYKDLFEKAVNNTGKQIVGSMVYAPHEMDFSKRVESALKYKPDTVFLPDSYRTAVYIAGSMAALEKNPPKLLGIDRWNTQAIIRKGQEFVEGSIFPIVFDVNSENAKAFVENFNETYGYDPTLLEALGFDSMNLIKMAYSKGATTREGMLSALKSLNNVPSVMGTASVDSFGEVKHYYKLMTIKDGEIIPLE